MLDAHGNQGEIIGRVADTLGRIKTVHTRENRVALVLLVSQIGVALGALLVNIFSARALGPSGRGALALHLQISYIVGAAALLGRDRSLLATAAQGVSLSSGMRQMVRLLAMPLMVGAVASLAAGLAFQNSPTLAAGALIVGYVLVLAGIMLSRFSRSVSIAAKTPGFLRLVCFRLPSSTGRHIDSTVRI